MKTNIDFLDEACDPVDACVFSGDVLTTEAGRQALEKWITRWQEEIASHRRSEEMEARKKLGLNKICRDCEWGKYRFPCGYKDWPFDFNRDDPACADFQEWGEVF